MARVLPPEKAREIKAQMAYRVVNLKQLSERSGIPYASASKLLNGSWCDPSRLDTLLKAIRTFPKP